MRTAVPAFLSLVLAGCSCPFAAGVQHPDLKPEKGTPQEPADVLGKVPARTWSETTIDSAVPNKDGVKAPRQGVITTITGEVIDVSCYLQLGKHGAGHKECAQKCAKNGNPIGLLTADGRVYLLMAEEHHPRRDGDTKSLRDALIDRMAQIIKVTGTATSLNGQKALFVSGFAK
jgi:hypothetical protein